MKINLIFYISFVKYFKNGKLLKNSIIKSNLDSKWNDLFEILYYNYNLI